MYYFEKKVKESAQSPMNAVRPSDISKSRSKSAKTSDAGWWIVQMIVFPWAAKVFSDLTMDCAMKESRPKY